MRNFNVFSNAGKAWNCVCAPCAWHLHCVQDRHLDKQATRMIRLRAGKLQSAWRSSRIAVTVTAGHNSASSGRRSPTQPGIEKRTVLQPAAAAPSEQKQDCQGQGDLQRFLQLHGIQATQVPAPEGSGQGSVLAPPAPIAEGQMIWTGDAEQPPSEPASGALGGQEACRVKSLVFLADGSPVVRAGHPEQGSRRGVPERGPNLSAAACIFDPRLQRAECCGRRQDGQG